MQSSKTNLKESAALDDRCVVLSHDAGSDVIMKNIPSINLCRPQMVCRRRPHRVRLDGVSLYGSSSAEPYRRLEQDLAILDAASRIILDPTSIVFDSFAPQLGNKAICRDVRSSRGCGGVSLFHVHPARCSQTWCVDCKPPVSAGMFRAETKMRKGIRHVETAYESYVPRFRCLKPRLLAYTKYQAVDPSRTEQGSTAKAALVSVFH